LDAETIVLGPDKTPPAIPIEDAIRKQRRLIFLFPSLMSEFPSSEFIRKHGITDDAIGRKIEARDNSFTKHLEPGGLHRITARPLSGIASQRTKD
jgi:hypothetical protein